MNEQRVKAINTLNLLIWGALSNQFPIFSYSELCDGVSPNSFGMNKWFTSTAPPNETRQSNSANGFSSSSTDKRLKSIPKLTDADPGP